MNIHNICQIYHAPFILDTKEISPEAPACVFPLIYEKHFLLATFIFSIFLTFILQGFHLYKAFPSV